jgi:hypothetical protein
MHFVYLAQMSEWSSAREALAGATEVSWASTLSELCRTLGVDAGHPGR